MLLCMSESITDFFPSIYGAGVEPSALLLRPYIGLLYQPWMKMVVIVQQLVNE
jgi:hypothetical protein